MNIALTQNKGRLITAYLAIIVICVALYIPFFGQESFGLEALIIPFALCLLLHFDFSLIKNLIPTFFMVVITMFMLVAAGRYGETGFNAPVNNVLKFVYIFFAMSVGLAVKTMTPIQRKKIILLTVLLILVSAAISLFYLITVNVYAVRGPADYGLVGKVMSFNQIYSVPIFIFIATFVLFAMWKEISLFYKICIVLIIGFFIFFIVKSLFTTALILAIAGIIVGILASILYKSIKSFVKLMFCVGVLIGVMYIFSNEIANMLYDFVGIFQYTLRDRLIRVIDLIFNLDSGIKYSFDGRKELAQFSINSFMKHPLFGVMYFDYGYGIIGCHQEWADLLGTFGIVGTLVFLLTMVFNCKVMIDYSDKKIDKYCFIASIIIIFILGFLNPCLTSHSLFAAFVIAPNISCLTAKWK